MLDIDFIRENPDKVKAAATNKNLNPAIVDDLLKVDEKRRQLTQEVESLRAKKNKLQDQINDKVFVSKDGKFPDELVKSRQEIMAIKQLLKDKEPELTKSLSDFSNLMLQIPNVTLPDVPVGKDSSGNVEVKKWGDIKELAFTPKDHVELGTSLNILDLERGVKVAGFRGYFLKNEGAIMHMAIMRYAMDKLVEKGFTAVVPPVVDKHEAFVNSGHFPWGEREAYKLESDETEAVPHYLAGTAEVPLVAYHAGETLNEKDLPVLMAGFSPCYRREVGSYGKDTRGIYRIHEFLKIEQVILCQNDWKVSDDWHLKLREYAEEMLQDLGLPYRVLLMCTGDMGEPQAKKFDIETWMPGRDEYGETMSDSNMGEFQARRANIKYRTKTGDLAYVHTLNNTAIASPRILIALWENYQQEDGSIKVPDSLVKYTGFSEIKKK